MNTAANQTALLQDALSQALGPSALINQANTTLYSTDVYSAGAAPGLVVRPVTQVQVADAVRISTQAGWAITRGIAFGAEGAGFARLNIRCPRSKLVTALASLAKAMAAQQKM